MNNKRQKTNYTNKSPNNKYLNPIEEIPETDDIIKKLENLNFSSDEKSFDTPFISRNKTKDKKNLHSNKSNSITDLIKDNIEDFPFDPESIKEADISDFITNKLINKNKKEEIHSEKNIIIF